ncbi:hypothetical protein C8R43DRAFT_1102648 [Mycena crocata]|nr:hypothetical protein C8R43DRAFT_1102648 [Mycena crocata]
MIMGGRRGCAANLWSRGSFSDLIVAFASYSFANPPAARFHAVFAPTVTSRAFEGLPSFKVTCQWLAVEEGARRICHTVQYKPTQRIDPAGRKSPLNTHLAGSFLWRTFLLMPLSPKFNVPSLGSAKSKTSVFHLNVTVSRRFGYVTFAEQAAATAVFASPAPRIGTSSISVDYAPAPVRRKTPDPGPPGRVLHVGNLPHGLNEADIRAKFTPFGPINTIRLPTRASGLSAPFTYVEFVQEADAASAYRTFADTPLTMLGRRVSVVYARVNQPSDTLSFWDYPGDEAALRLVLREFGGTIREVSMFRKNTGSVRFDSIDSATDVLEKCDGLTTPHGPLNLRYVANNPRRAASTPSAVLLIKNLRFGAEETDLRALFAPFGALRDVRIPRRQSGGHAYVEFLHEADAITAYERFRSPESPLYLFGRRLGIDYEMPRATLPPCDMLRFRCYGIREEGVVRRILEGEFDAGWVRGIWFLRDPTTGNLLGRGHIVFDSTERAAEVRARLDGAMAEHGEPLSLVYAMNGSASAGAGRDRSASAVVGRHGSGLAGRILDSTMERRAPSTPRRGLSTTARHNGATQ